MKGLNIGTEIVHPVTGGGETCDNARYVLCQNTNSQTPASADPLRPAHRFVNIGSPSGGFYVNGNPKVTRKYSVALPHNTQIVIEKERDDFIWVSEGLSGSTGDHGDTRVRFTKVQIGDQT